MKTRVVFIALCGIAFLFAMGFEGYPYTDDETYGPLWRKALDPSLYPGDPLAAYPNLHGQFVLLARPLLHFFSYPQLRLPAAMVLSAGMALATAWVLEGLGGAGVLTILLLYGSAGTHWKGVGRGTFGGMFDGAFHPQGLALMLLLLAYGAALRRRGRLTGIFLALCFWAHPAVALHGLVLLGLGLAVDAAWTRTIPWPFLRACALPVGLFGLPRLAWILASQRIEQAASAVPAGFDLWKDLVLLRVPHEHVQPMTQGHVLQLVWLLCLVVPSLVLLRSRNRSPRPLLLGLLAGHGLFLAMYALLGWYWCDAPLILHRFHWSRTSPLLVFLLHLLPLAAVEAGFSADEEDRGARLAAICIFVSHLLSCLIFQVVSPAICLLVLPALWLGPRGNRPGQGSRSGQGSPPGQSSPPPRGAPVLLGLLAVGLLAIAWQTPLLAPLEDTEWALYAWARRKTEPSAMFVTPPSMARFRLLARRPSYIDWKTLFVFNAPDLSRAAALRQRLVAVARPDSHAMEQGYLDLDAWDRCYLRRNSKARIAATLRAGKGRYWLRDRHARSIAPYHPPVDEGPEKALSVAYENERFVVYELASGAKEGSP